MQTEPSAASDPLHARLVQFTLDCTVRKYGEMVAAGEVTSVQVARIVEERRAKLAGFTAQRIAERLLIDLPPDEFHRC